MEWHGHESVIEPFLHLRKGHVRAELIDEGDQLASHAGQLVEPVKLDRLHISMEARRR